MNSQTRIPDGAGIETYVARNWNGRANSTSPAMFHGVSRLPEHDDHGQNLYGVDQWLQDALVSCHVDSLRNR